MKEVIQAALSVVVPGQEEYMWNCLQEEREIADVSEEPAAKRKRIDTGLVQTLTSAHNDAENWQTKRQILSLFVNDFSKTELQEMIAGLSKWRIDQARCHATDVGEGQSIHDKPIFRARLDPVKTDHFVDYISRSTSRTCWNSTSVAIYVEATQTDGRTTCLLRRVTPLRTMSPTIFIALSFKRGALFTRTYSSG